MIKGWWIKGVCLRNWFLVMGVGMRWNVSFGGWYAGGFGWRVRKGRKREGRVERLKCSVYALNIIG